MDIGRSIRLECPAKVNLSLDIVGKRDDGYHFLKMVMQSIDLCDYVTITKNNTGNISVSCDDESVICDESNTAFKAAKVFFEECEIDDFGVDIKIEKNIPSQAGLGGASADAAGVLVGLNELYKQNLSKTELCNIGERVGADVPFCILGGGALAEGIGDILSPIPSLEECFFTVVKPDLSISTKEAYGKYGSAVITRRPDTSSLIAAIVAQDLENLSSHLCNVFEETISSDVIYQIKDEMLENEAIGALMTGSGSAVFGIFEQKRKAQKCADKFDDFASFVCEPVDHGAIIVE